MRWAVEDELKQTYMYLYIVMHVRVLLIAVTISFGIRQLASPHEIIPVHWLQADRAPVPNEKQTPMYVRAP